MGARCLPSDTLIFTYWRKQYSLASVNASFRFFHFDTSKTAHKWGKTRSRSWSTVRLIVNSEPRKNKPRKRESEKKLGFSVFVCFLGHVNKNFVIREFLNRENSLERLSGTISIYINCNIKERLFLASFLMISNWMMIYLIFRFWDRRLCNWSDVCSWFRINWNQN